MSSRSLVAGLIVAACLVTGCNPSAKLVGKWDADMTQINASLNKTKESRAQPRNPLAALDSMTMGTMTGAGQKFTFARAKAE